MIRLTLVFLVAIGASHNALGHAGPPFGLHIFLDADRKPVGAITAHGLLRVEGDDLTWISDEGLPGIRREIRYIAPDHILAATPEGLLVTSDWGCSWSPAEGEIGSAPLEFFARTPPGQPLYAATKTAIYQGDGTTWQRLTALEATALESLVVGPEGTLWSLQRDDAGVAIVAWAASDATAWSAFPVADLETRRSFRLHGLSPDGSILYTSESDPATGDARLIAHDITDITAPVESVAGVFPGAVISAMVDTGSGLHAITNFFFHHRAAPGDDFEVLSGAPQLCLDVTSEPGVLWGCSRLESDFHFQRSEDGLTFAGVFPFDTVCPATCPAGSEGEALRDLHWPAAYNSGLGAPSCAPMNGAESAEDTSVVEPPEDRGQETCGGCAIRSDQPSSPWPWVLLALVFRGVYTRSGSTSKQSREQGNFPLNTE